MADPHFAELDHDRARRTGLPEVIFGAGKTAAQVGLLMDELSARSTGALATHVEPSVASEVLANRPHLQWDPTARVLWVGRGGDPVAGPVWVLSGGTSDLPVLEEAARTAEWLGLDVHRAPDVGVAGVHRLLSRIDALQSARVIIAIAGMEGALPSVVAGLVKAPVIAVPTSIGYGTSLRGFTPLFAMLTSCAQGVSVVNIDNGFGAAMAASRIVRGG